MNEFVATVYEKKKSVKIKNSESLLFDGEELEYSFSKIGEFSFLLKINNKVFEIIANEIEKDKYGILIDGHYLETKIKTRLQEKADELSSLRKKLHHHDNIKAPMPGMIIKIKKKLGDHVEIGESVLILEAMKMENDVRSPATGIIKELFIKEGDSVEKGFVLLTIE